MPTFTVTLDFNAEPVTIDAEYYSIDDSFVTFKDVNHKQVSSFQERFVVSIERVTQRTSVGTLTVQVVPQIDADAMTALLKEIDKRVRRTALDGIRR